MQIGHCRMNFYSPHSERGLREDSGSHVLQSHQLLFRGVAGSCPLRLGCGPSLRIEQVTPKKKLLMGFAAGSSFALTSNKPKPPSIKRRLFSLIAISEQAHNQHSLLGRTLLLLRPLLIRTLSLHLARRSRFPSPDPRPLLGPRPPLNIDTARFGLHLLSAWCRLAHVAGHHGAAANQVHRAATAL